MGSVEGKELLCCCGSTECRGRLLWSTRTYPNIPLNAEPRLFYVLLSSRNFITSPSFRVFIFFTSMWLLMSSIKCFLYLRIKVSSVTGAPALLRMYYCVNYKLFCVFWKISDWPKQLNMFYFCSMWIKLAEVQLPSKQSVSFNLSNRAESSSNQLNSI